MENELQFDQVQRPAGGTTCSSCHGALLGSYFQVNGKVLCQNCAENVRKFFESKEGGFGRFLKATAFGIGGGLAGGAVYTGVLAMAHLNIAFITILIGWLAGKAVRTGSGGRGGVGYQILAVLITYGVIGLSLVASEMFSGGVHQNSLFQTVLLLVFGGIAGPVVSAIHSPLGGLITLFGLLQAWQLNKPIQVNITGPHALAPAGPGPVAPIPPTLAAPPAAESFPPPSA